MNTNETIKSLGVIMLTEYNKFKHEHTDGILESAITTLANIETKTLAEVEKAFEFLENDESLPRDVYSDDFWGAYARLANHDYWHHFKEECLVIDKNIGYIGDVPVGFKDKNRVFRIGDVYQSSEQAIEGRVIGLELQSNGDLTVTLLFNEYRQD